MSRRNSSHQTGSLFDQIPEYDQIISDLSRGNLTADFSLDARKSKLSNSLLDILFDQRTDELSYFVLFMDSLGKSNLIKFILDLNDFDSAVKKSTSNMDHNQIISEDALSIFSKYITQDAVNTINLPSDIIDTIIHKICPENSSNKIDIDCFASGKDHVFSLLEKELYDKYLVSEYHCKYMLTSLEGRSVQLSDLLYDDLGVVYFLEYLEQENKSDLLKFWVQAENFSRNILNFDSKNNNDCTVESLYKQWQADAIIIYDNFISLQAKNKLGFDQFARQSVESNICFQAVDNEDLASFVSSYADSFYVPMLIVYSILDRAYFQKFLDGVLFTKFIREIKTSSNIKGVKRQIPVKVNKEIKEKKKGSLWDRAQSGNLQFGKVDSIGRYIAYDGSVNVRSDLPNHLLNDVTNEYDDDWSCGDSEVGIESRASVLEKKIKMKLEKFVSMMPLNVGRSGGSYSKANTMEDVELAEKMADLLVREVERDNQLIKSPV